MLRRRCSRYGVTCRRTLLRAAALLTAPAVEYAICQSTTPSAHDGFPQRSLADQPLWQRLVRLAYPLHELPRVFKNARTVWAARDMPPEGFRVFRGKMSD
jgi:hypothetical protein